MTYTIFKALHLVFVITWFAGLFYIVRLFIYSAEANELKDELKKRILLEQYTIMKRRLWYGITWPSAIITFFCGVTLVYLLGAIPAWLILKLSLLFFLYLYHFSCHYIYKQQLAGNYKYSPFQLRLWNEVATLFLFGIVFVVTLKGQLSIYSIIFGLVFLAILLLISIKIYAKRRKTLSS